MIGHVPEQVVPSGPAPPAAANKCMVTKAVEDAIAERALKVLIGKWDAERPPKHANKKRWVVMKVG